MFLNHGNPAVLRPQMKVSEKMLEHLQERIGYHFRQVKLLESAMTHSSWVNENDSSSPHNERLEFLGDAVLELTVSEVLFTRFPHEREGELTRMRSRLVSKPSLADRAKALGLDTLLRLGKGEESQGGRERGSLLSDAFEALLGAVFLDGGYAAAQTVVGVIFEECWPQTRSPLRKDAKSRLQEATQKQFKARPNYSLLGSSGPDHEKVFTVRLVLPDDSVFVANGPSMKRAEQEAALLALEALDPTLNELAENSVPEAMLAE